MQVVRASLLALVAAACVATAAASAGAKSSGVISYWSDDPWPSIWTVRPDGSERARILRTQQNAKRPRISPDGRWVAFDGTPPGRPTLSDFDIQLIRRNGTGLRTITRSKRWDTDPQWSPDGALLGFTRTPRADWMKSWTWTVRPDGAELRRIAQGHFGRWSPDGTKLVLSTPTAASTGDLFVVDAEGANRTLLLSSPLLDLPADWSPNGTRILFSRYNSISDRSSVYVMNADGTGVRRLASGVAGSFSPDGTQIVYSRSFLGQLLVMQADGSRKRAIPGAVGGDPDWS